MMKLKKITANGNESMENAVNEFFRREHLSKSDIVHIRPITMNTGGLSDIVAVYVFYDKYGEDQ